MHHELREYQRAAIAAIADGWREWRRQLLVLPTGAGKTVVFAHVARAESDAGRRVLILAHRDELIEQARDKLARFGGVSVDIEKASHRAVDRVGDPAAPRVVVGSVATLRGDRLDAWPRDWFDLVIVDEAHHVLADSYVEIVEHFAGARLLGVTATPDRGDRRGLGAVFENIAYEYPMRAAIRDGHLCRIVADQIPIPIDLRSVRTVQGDYDAAESAARIEPVLGRVAREVAARAGDRKTLVFLPLVRMSMRFAEMLRVCGVDAMHVDGESEDRRDVLARFAAGRRVALCNASLLLEGYDCPDISCVVVLRPTRVRSLYQQMVGRGTRVADGKPNLLLLDFLWLLDRHQLCQPASLVARDAEHAREITAVISDSDAAVDLFDAEDAADAARLARLEEAERMRRAEADRLRRLGAVIAANGRRAPRLSIDPMEMSLALRDLALAEYEPTLPWHSAPATERQIQALRRLGIDADAVRDRGHANAILGRLAERSRSGLCTVRQAMLIRRLGAHPEPFSLTFAEAHAILDARIGRGGGAAAAAAGAAS